MLPFNATARRLSVSERTLVSWNIKYERKHDGSLVVPGDIDLSGRDLTSLPDFSSVTVEGCFDCSNNKLTTLKGAPRAVQGYFRCQFNQLESLEGAPRTAGDFECFGNRLTSLEHAPPETGSFACGYNQLASLKHAPQVVHGDFLCEDNRLTSLEHAPQAVDGSFDCSANLLTSLAHAPSDVLGFICRKNPLMTFEGAPKTFVQLYSDFGLIHSADELEAQSAQLRERVQQQVIMRATTLQGDLHVGKPLRFRRET